MNLHSDIQKQINEREMLIEEIHKIQQTLKAEHKRQGVTARVVLDGVVQMLETIIRKLK